MYELAEQTKAKFEAANERATTAETALATALADIADAESGAAARFAGVDGRALQSFLFSLSAST